MLHPPLFTSSHGTPTAGRSRRRFVAFRNSGTTFIEMIVVVGIIGVLAVSAVGYYGDIRSQAESAVVTENLRLFREALARHFKQNMSYPTSLASFTAANFVGKTPRSMFFDPMQNASATLFVEIPDTAAGASENAWQATKTLLVPWDAASGGPGSQFRNVKMKIDQTFMNW